MSIKKTSPKRATLNEKQAKALMEELLKKLDLKVEPMAELNKRLRPTDHLCWQGSAINGTGSL